MASYAQMHTEPRGDIKSKLIELGRGLANMVDDGRRALARGLRSFAPGLVRMGEDVARDLWRVAEDIDRSLRREGKAPSTPPPPMRHA